LEDIYVFHPKLVDGDKESVLSFLGGPAKVAAVFETLP
jgi:hypothetical protein